MLHKLAAAAAFAATTVGFAMASSCTLPDPLKNGLEGNNSTALSPCVAGASLANDTSCRVKVMTGYYSPGGTCANGTFTTSSACSTQGEVWSLSSNTYQCSSGSLTAPTLEVTGCLANFYQSSGSSSADGVCTACPGDSTITADNTFEGSPTTCTGGSNCTLPASFGPGIESDSTNGMGCSGGAILSSGSECYIKVSSTGYTPGTGTTQYSCLGGILTSPSLTATGCAANFHETSSGTCSQCTSPDALSAANFTGSATTCETTTDCLSAVATAGYSVTADPTSMTKASWNTTGFDAACAQGYTGSPVAAACSTVNTPYTLTGCVAAEKCWPAGSNWSCTAHGFVNNMWNGAATNVTCAGTTCAASDYNTTGTCCTSDPSSGADGTTNGGTTAAANPNDQLNATTAAADPNDQLNATTAAADPNGQLDGTTAAAGPNTQLEDAGSVALPSGLAFALAAAVLPALA